MQSLGTRRVERGQRPGEGNGSGAASQMSSDVDGAGSQVWEGSLRQLVHCQQQSSPSQPGFLRPLQKIPWKTTTVSHASSRSCRLGRRDAELLRQKQLTRTKPRFDPISRRWRLRTFGERPLEQTRGGETTSPRPEGRSVGAVSLGVQEESDNRAQLLILRLLQRKRKVHASMGGKPFCLKTGRWKPDKSRAWKRRIPTPTDVGHGEKMWDPRVLISSPFLAAGN